MCCMAVCGFVSLWASEHSSTVQSQTLEQRRSAERLEFSLCLVSPSGEDVCLSSGLPQYHVAQAGGTGELIWDAECTTVEFEQKSNYRTR